MPYVLSGAKKRYLASEQATWAAEQLQQMVEDVQYNTPSKLFYFHEEKQTLTYVEWNLMYLCEHPQVRVSDYLSNLRLKAKIRGPQ